MKTLFRSTKTTLQMIISGIIQREDLASGLFILDCSRQVFMNYDACRAMIASWCETCNVGDEELDHSVIMVNAYEQLVDAILKAESDGRIVWSKTGAEITYDQVDDLLSANGEGYTTSNVSKQSFIDDRDLDENVRNFVIWKGFFEALE